MVLIIPKKLNKIYGTIIYEGMKDIDDARVRNTVQQADEDKIWRYARPLGYKGLFYRTRCAWLVFTEKADIVVWQKPKTK